MHVFNPSTGEHEPPRDPGSVRLYPNTIRSLRKLQASGYDLFLVSNQPDFAKGKTTLASMEMVHNELDRILISNGVHFKEYYYCYHHPKGVVPEYSYECDCRKPKAFFLFKAANTFGVDLSNSWMVGDRDSDVECGKAAGTRTILIEEPTSAHKRGLSRPDHTAKSLKDAVGIITS